MSSCPFARLADEMGEIADSLAAADLPPGFHEAAREVFRRLTNLKGEDAPTTAEVLNLLGTDPDAGGRPGP